MNRSRSSKPVGRSHFSSSIAFQLLAITDLSFKPDPLFQLLDILPVREIIGFDSDRVGRRSTRQMYAARLNGRMPIIIDQLFAGGTSHFWFSELM
jgi:hypothetical protein